MAATPCYNGGRPRFGAGKACHGGSRSCAQRLPTHANGYRTTSGCCAAEKALCSAVRDAAPPPWPRTTTCALFRRPRGRDRGLPCGLQDGAWTGGRRGFAIAGLSTRWEERGVYGWPPRRLRAVPDRRRGGLVGPPGHDRLAEGRGEGLSSCAARTIHVRKGAQPMQMPHGIPTAGVWARNRCAGLCGSR